MPMSPAAKNLDVHSNQSAPEEKWRHSKVTPCSIAYRLSLLSTEGEVHAGEVLEVVLGAGVAGAVDAEAGVEIVHLDRPQLHVRSQGVIKPATEFHGKRIVVVVAGGQAMDGVVNAGVGVAVRGAEQSFSKW